jgi:hypothetical protein
MSYKIWDTIEIFNSEVTVSAGTATSYEITPMATEAYVMFTQSGTASQVTVQLSSDDTNWFTQFNAISATFHALTTIPRYIRVISPEGATADSQRVVSLAYRKEIRGG